VSKRLGKWKTKQLKDKGWVIKIYCHFQSMTHSIIEYWKAMSTVIYSYVNTVYVNQSESLSWSFSDLSGGKYGVSKESTCADNMLDCRKFHKQLSNSCHRSCKGYVWQLNGIHL
jgi:hypothetical protein